MYLPSEFRLSRSIDQGKRKKALTAWAKCVRDTYGIDARFTHVDKDMAEIGMLKDVWNSKISLCWWHLRRAVRTRLASAKLSTTPYDPGRAHAEFSFIDPAFAPQGRADAGEYEGGIPDTITAVISTPPQPLTFVTSKGLRITLPARQPLTSAPVNGAARAASRSVANGESEHMSEAGAPSTVATADRMCEDTMEDVEESEPMMVEALPHRNRRVALAGTNGNAAMRVECIPPESRSMAPRERRMRRPIMSMVDLSPCIKGSRYRRSTSAEDDGPEEAEA
ncbi:hypothetical protein B0H10DRAFT_2219408 [Mycena sp. CBHHK59/15]|nr:hypothetical protein B0H10DRAFT_2219408 [Mycena sp. CBHHK59/15]